MVLHARHDGTSCIISLKPDSIAVSVDDATVVAWDRGGRLYSVYRDDVTWRRGLSGRVIEKRQERAGRVRRVPDGAEGDRVVDDAAAFARRVVDLMRSPAWRWLGPVDPVTAQEARTLLELCARFDTPAARADAQAFARVYSPVGILPPDQYLSLVVQATEGCSFNSCTFCDLYRQPYRVRTPDEFRTHLAAVLAYLGESRALRSRGLFLGAANALAVPMARLLPIFEILVEEADSLRRGVCAFVDGFTGRLRETSDYRLLRHHGLRRVYVGLESGHDPLLEFVRKPGTAAAAVDTVRAIKASGVHVGVIVMTGLGGRPFAEGHVADTSRVLSEMGLGAGDLLYFSDLVEVPLTPYPLLAAEAAIEPLPAEARRAQREAILAGARFAGGRPLAATYDIREFVY
jgi:hypothetical protein